MKSIIFTSHLYKLTVKYSFKRYSVSMMASRDAKESVKPLLKDYAKVIKNYPKDEKKANQNNPKANDYLYFGDKKNREAIRYISVGGDYYEQGYIFWKLPIDCEEKRQEVRPEL